jgi:hypothetical protein
MAARTPQNSYQTITSPQASRFWAIAMQTHKDHTKVMGYLRNVIGVQKKDDIPVSRYEGAIAWAEGKEDAYRFNRGRGNVQLVYEAGYPTTPLDIEQAVIDQVAFTLRRQPNLGTVSQTMNGILTTSFSQKDLAPGVQAVVNFDRDRAVVGL